MDTWSWSDFVAQVSASLVGGLLAACVAIWVVSVERRSRRREREADDDIRLRGLRARTVGDLLEAIRERVDVGSGFALDRGVELRILALLNDGTPESYDVYRWTRMKIEESSLAEPSGPTPRRLINGYDVLKVMLIAWLRPDDEAGALANMRRELDNT